MKKWHDVWSGVKGKEAGGAGVQITALAGTKSERATIKAKFPE